MCYEFNFSLDFKDFLNVLFWIFTGFIAYYTFKNAKKTLFNPVRSEMVKYQLKNITDFIDKHTAKGYTFDAAIDYYHILKLNIECNYILRIITNEQIYDNHVFSETDENILKFCKENIVAVFYIKMENNTKIFEVLNANFDTVKSFYSYSLQDLKDDNSFIGVVYLTKRSYDFYTDLINLETNPFIPNQIKLEIKNTVKNINQNFIKIEKVLSENLSSSNELNYKPIYDQFEIDKLYHSDDLQNLRESISTYFKVDGL